MVCNRVYKMNNLTVRTMVSPKTGYGWLAYRAFLVFPTDAPLSVYVLPPRDAVLVYANELQRDAENGVRRACLFAVDGTELPTSWLRAAEFFDYYIVMLNHNNFEKQCEKVVGEFYPKPRTLVWLETHGIATPERKVQRKLLGTIAHGHARKNIDMVVAIAYELHKRRADVEFSIITDERTATLWRHYAPPNATFLTGLSDDELIDWYLSLWAYFSLSSGEGGALPAVEAALLSVPTILPKHTAFATIGASVFLTNLHEVDAEGDANLGGKLFVPEPMELVEIVTNCDALPPPPTPSISFEVVPAALLPR